MSTLPTKEEALGGAILEAFEVYTEPKHWEIHCTRCDLAWTLPRKAQTHPGNLLFLLNHARGHEAAV